MAGLTNAMEVEVLKLITGQATAIYTTTPIVPHVGLLTVAPTESTGGTEVTGGSYARVSGSSKFGAPSAADPSTCANNAAITFPTATADWGNVVAFGLYTASSSGTLLAWGTVTKTIQNGDTAAFAIGTLVVTAD